MKEKPRGPSGIRSKRAIALKLSLIENSYNFLNESLKHYRRTSRNIQDWPFALLHITQSIELMLKQALQRIHRILIFEDVDHPKYTVSLEQALDRLQSVGVGVEEKERLVIRKAAGYRNLVVHYEFELNQFEWKKIYAQLFEFVHFFHVKHFGEEIHPHITREHWPTEARLMKYFKKNFVVYNGVEMAKESPAEIMAAQRETHLELGGVRYERIKYGDEKGWLEIDPSFAEIPCHDCSVVKGQLHLDGCDVEECPKCRHCLLGCDCSPLDHS